MVNNVVIIQARLGSTRLPRKVLLNLGGRPAISWGIDAARKIPGVSSVVIATTTNESDDEIVQWCSDNNVNCYRGPEDDVLKRYVMAATAENADNVIRITSDCPFIDPHVCGQVLALHQMTEADFTTNNDPPTWPDGLDCEVMTCEALKQADMEATRLSDREHVAPYIRNNRYKFQVEDLVCPVPGLSQERWTLDTPEDLEFLRAVAEKLPTQTPTFMDVLNVLNQNAGIRDLNSSQVRDSGWSKSIAAEVPDLNPSFETSNKLLEKATSVIPLGAQTFSKSWQQYPRKCAPMFLTHGQGARVWDVDGNEYVDLVSGLLPVLLGYRNSDVDAAVRRQLAQGVSYSLSTELEIQLAEEIIDLVPCAETVRFGKNGTDATSGAIRVARAKTGRERIAVCGYHGWQDWYIGVTTRNKGIPKAVCDLTHTFPYNDLNALEDLLKSHKDEFAAVILEPAGANLPQGSYLKGVQELAHRHGALLIFDEIVTGFRWAPGGAQERYGVIPDLSSFGKAMGNGLPISAVVGRADVMREMEEVFFSSTFGGEALSLAASLKVIEKIKTEPIVERIWNVGQLIKDHVANSIEKNGLSGVISLIGEAPWSIIAYNDTETTTKECIKTAFIREMLKSGVLVNASNNVTAAFTETDLAKVFGAYDHALAYVANALKDGDLETQLGDQVIQPVFSIRST